MATWKYTFVLTLLLLFMSSYFASASTPASNITSIAAGNGFSMALMEDGSVWMWGSNYYGQMGNLSITDKNNPFPVPVPVSNVKSISAGLDHVVVLEDDGTVWSWGASYKGTPGNGSEYNGSIFIPTRAAISNVELISAGCYDTFAIRNDGTVWAWGYNRNGQLGDGTNVGKFFPEQITGLDNIIDIKADTGHTMALDKYGNVWRWGYNITGSSDKSNANDDIYFPVQVPVSNVTAISIGYSHALALKDDGTVWAWGNNSGGELGDGTTMPRNGPVQVKGLDDIVDIGAGAFYSMAVKKDGTVWAWGEDEGRFGNGHVSYIVTSPVRVSIDNVKKIAVGDGHVLALKNDGTLWAWGNNVLGQLGNGKLQLESLFPVKVLINEGSEGRINASPSATYTNDTEAPLQSQNGLDYIRVLALLGLFTFVGGITYMIFLRKK